MTILRSSRSSRPAARFSAALLAALLACGCTGSSVEDRGQPKPDAREGSSDGKGQQPAEKKPPEPDYSALWDEQAERVAALMDEKKLDEAQSALDEFAGIYPKGKEPSEEQRRELAGLIERRDQLERELRALEREEQLAAAQKFASEGQFAEATRAIARVLALSPTPEQYQTATELNKEVQRRLKIRRDLESLRQLLGSEVRSNVNSARAQLMSEPETAIGLLLEWVQLHEQPILVANAMNVLRRIKRPDVSLPTMVEVLSSLDHQQNWPDAVKEIALSRSPGAGPLLLELISRSDKTEQRRFALQALSQVVDPPEETLLTLLPLVFENGPLLKPALQAIIAAVRIRDQHDLAARRGLETPPTPAQGELLERLPTRLEELIAQKNTEKAKEKADAGGDARVLTGSPFDPPDDPPFLAHVLAVATRQKAPESLPIAKVHGFGSQIDESPAAAVLDGVWDSIEPATMWRYPAGERGLIVLDLGENRTVTGVRIWNFNQQNEQHRGWKEAEVFVSTQPRALDADAEGLVPPAPGAAEAPDYSTTIPVDFAWGRYVKIQAKSLWNPDQYSGLTEIQVLGF